MIRKSVKRFSEKIMLNQIIKARWRFNQISSRFSLNPLSLANQNALSLPHHLQDRPTRGRVHIPPRMNKSVALIEADRARVVVVHKQRDGIRRKTFRFIDQGIGKFCSPMAGGYDKLVEIGVGVDRDESDELAYFFGDDDRGLRHQLLAPALTPPRHARGEIDFRIGFEPSLTPQRDCGVFVVVAIGAEGEGQSRRVPGEWCEGSARTERDTGPTAPSISIRYGGCGGRLPRSSRYRAAEIRQSRPRPAAAPARRAKSDIAPPRSRAPRTIPSSI